MLTSPMVYINYRNQEPQLVAIWYYYHMVTKLRYLHLEEIEPSTFWTLTQVLLPGLQWLKPLGYWGLDQICIGKHLLDHL